MNTTNELVIEGNHVKPEFDSSMIELNELQLVLVGGGSGDPILA